MHVDHAVIAPTAGPDRAGAPGPTDADRARLRTLAAEFESMLIAQMLRGMKEAMAPESDEGGLGAALIGDTITTELSLALGRTGSLGLSELVSSALARLGGATPGPAGAAVTIPIRPAPDVDAGPLDERVPPAPVAAPAPAPTAAHRHEPVVTSSFGWRADPIHGARRFHAGTDVRAAYGQPILAASGGVVTSAGEQPGYGLVVTVDHGNGVETRYAHLSSTTVRPGSRVDAGEVIARAGASGRATGPHLHFEVRQHGAPVDPTRVEGLGPVVG